MWPLSQGWTVQGFSGGLNEYPGVKSLRNHSDLDLICLLWGIPAGSKSSRLRHRCSRHPRRPAFWTWTAHKCRSHLLCPALHLTTWGEDSQSAGWRQCQVGGCPAPQRLSPGPAYVAHSVTYLLQAALEELHVLIPQEIQPLILRGCHAASQAF